MGELGHHAQRQVAAMQRTLLPALLDRHTKQKGVMQHTEKRLQVKLDEGFLRPVAMQQIPAMLGC